MRRSAKKKILVLFLIFFGLLFVFRLMSPKKEVTNISKNKTQAEPAKKAITFEVIVARRDIDVGEKIGYYNITRKTIQKEEMFPGFITVDASRRVLGKKITNMAIKKGGFIDSSVLSDSNDEWGLVQPGMSVKSIAMSVNEGIGAILKPGMIVRIIYNEEGKNASIVDSARVILVRGRPIKGEINVIGVDPKEKDIYKNSIKEKEEVFIEVTPQVAQMLALPHKGSFTLIPIKKHPDANVPDGYFQSGDMSKILFSGDSQKTQRSVIRSIRGDKIEFIDLNHKISKQGLNRAPAVIKDKKRAPLTRHESRRYFRFVPIYEFYDYAEVNSPYIIDYSIIDNEESR